MGPFTSGLPTNLTCENERLLKLSRPCGGDIGLNPLDKGENDEKNRNNFTQSTATPAIALMILTG